MFESLNPQSNAFFLSDVTATIESFKEILCLDNHSATIFPFSRVSSVLKLLDVTMNRVSLGLHFLNISEILVGSILDTYMISGIL